jgi:hypothetical protein
MINKEMKLKVIDLVIEDFSTRRVYNDGNARIIACYIKVLHTLKKLVSEHDDSIESILYFDYVRDYRGDMLSTGRINTRFLKEFETVKSYIDKLYGFIDGVIDPYVFNNCKELIFTKKLLDSDNDEVITIDLTQPLVLD